MLLQYSCDQFLIKTEAVVYILEIKLKLFNWNFQSRLSSRDIYHWRKKDRPAELSRTPTGQKKAQKFVYTASADSYTPNTAHTRAEFLEPLFLIKRDCSSSVAIDDSCKEPQLRGFNLRAACAMKKTRDRAFMGMEIDSSAIASRGFTLLPCDT